MNIISAFADLETLIENNPMIVDRGKLGFAHLHGSRMRCEVGVEKVDGAYYTAVDVVLPPGVPETLMDLLLVTAHCDDEEPHQFYPAESALFGCRKSSRHQMRIHLRSGEVE